MKKGVLLVSGLFMVFVLGSLSFAKYGQPFHRAKVGNDEFEKRVETVKNVLDGMIKKLDITIGLLEKASTIADAETEVRELVKVFQDGVAQKMKAQEGMTSEQKSMLLSKLVGQLPLLAEKMQLYAQAMGVVVKKHAEEQEAVQSFVKASMEFTQAYQDFFQN